MKHQRGSKNLRIRDFLYLDVERTKSIFAQLEEGLVTGRERIGGTAREISGGGGGGIPALLNLAAEGKFIWESEERETKTLHDYLYNHVETRMRDGHMVTAVDHSSFSSDDLRSDKLHSILDETSFVLIRGKINIDDYDYAKEILKHFNELSKFIVRCSTSQSASPPAKVQRRKEMEELSKYELPEWLTKGFERFFDTFYKERCMITIYPNIGVPSVYFSGHLRKNFIRDGLESVIFRYGTSPEVLWNVFAQIAYIPSKDSSAQEYMVSTGGTTSQELKSIDDAFRALFDSLRGIEKLATAVVYPAISIIPIAIYR